MIPTLPLPFSIAAGRYTLIAELGRGAHAVVYRAHDVEADRDVAIKFLRANPGEHGLSARFQREIRITSALEHPHIVPVYASGEWENQLYFVSELATQKSLDVRLEAERQLPVADAIEIAGDIADALHYAHRNGVVHRDVKPENILLGNDGALLADFGIARAVGIVVEQALVTSTGIAVGTLLYMSPEQICAERDIDGKSDQYSLALVLYEMLTGVRPHAAASVEALRALRLSGKQLSVRDHRPSVPDAIDRAVLRALSPAPADRFADCAAFARALRETSVENVNTATFMRRTRSRRVMAVVGGVAAMAALVAGGYATWGRNAAGGAADSAEPAPDAELSMAVVASDASGEDARRVVSQLRAELAAWPRVRVLDSSASAAVATNPSKVGRANLVSVSVQQLNGDSASLSMRVIGKGGERTCEQRYGASAGLTRIDVRTLALQLVGGAGASPDSAPGLETLGERNRLALSQYVTAWRWLRLGNLDSAAMYFRASGTTVPSFAAAHFRTAQSLAWINPADVAGWRNDAERALRFSPALGPVDSLNVVALVAMASGDYPSACATYRAAAHSDQSSFVALYGLGECLRFDRAVVADSRSPTKMRFRSNLLEALRMYSAALDVMPSARLGFLFERVPRLAYANTLDARGGRGDSPARELFSALPSLDGDSVVFWPIPMSEFVQSGTRSVPATYMQAIRRGRRDLLTFAERWIARAGDTFSARMGWALALELNGMYDGDSATRSERNALQALMRAKQSARNAKDSIEVGTAETRLRLRLSDFVSAAAVASHTLAYGDARVDVTTRNIAALAALMGDEVRLAIQEKALISSAASGNNDLPDWLATRYGEAAAAAALQHCEGLQLKLASLDSGLVNHFSSNELPAARSRLLVVAARLAVPCLGENAARLLSTTVPYDRAVQAYVRGDRRRSKMLLDSLATRRIGANAASTSWDVEFAESWLLVQIGDSSTAYTRLQGALNDLSAMSEHTLAASAPAAGLRNGVHLAAQLAKMRGDTVNAAKWAGWARSITDKRSN